jgi:hypothetical protein
MALHSTGAGREAFDLWDICTRGKLYRRGECAYRWETFDRERSRRVTIKTVFRLAHLAGWDSEINTDPDVLALVDVQRRRMLAAFAERHAAAMVNGKAVIVYRELDQDVERMVTRFSCRGDIATKYEPDKLPFVETTKDGPKIIYKPLVPIWIASKIRKTYEQLIFRPISRLVAGPVALPDGDMLDLYQGLAVTPKAGDCSLILRHILEVWCSGNVHAGTYVLGWLARMFRLPHERGHTVIVLRSGEGTGKNIIIDLLVRAMGEHAHVAVKPEELTGRFDDHLATSILVFANDCAQPRDLGSTSSSPISRPPSAAPITTSISRSTATAIRPRRSTASIAALISHPWSVAWFTPAHVHGPALKIGCARPPRRLAELWR